MNTAKVYHDSEGNECSIVQMVKREPDWAANRIQEGEKAEAKVKELEAENERLRKVLMIAAHEKGDIFQMEESFFDEGFDTNIVIAEWFEEADREGEE